MNTVFVLFTALAVFQVLDVSIGSSITPEASADNNGETKIASEVPEVVITTDQLEKKMEIEQNSEKEGKLPNVEDLKNKLAEEQKPLEVAEEADYNVNKEQVVPEEHHHQFDLKKEESVTNQDVMHDELSPTV